MDSKTNAFYPNSYVSLSDLSVLPSKVNITYNGEHPRLTGAPRIRVTSVVIYAKENDYGQSDVAIKIPKEDYETYLKFVEEHIRPKLELMFTDPNAKVLGKTLKKRKMALEIIHSFFEDDRSGDGSMIMKVRVNKASKFYLVYPDDNISNINMNDINWKSEIEMFAFLGISQSKSGEYYLRFNVTRAYVKYDPSLERSDQESEAYVPSFFLASNNNSTESFLKDI